MHNERGALKSAPTAPAASFSSFFTPLRHTMSMSATNLTPGIHDNVDRSLIYTPEERSLFVMMTGFFRSKLLSTAVELDLFTWLGDQSRTIEQIGNQFELPPRPTRVLVDALVNIGLLSVSKNRYQCSGTARKYLVKGKVQYIGENVALFDSLYTSCADFLGVLRSDRPSDLSYTYFFDKSDTRVGPYSDQMHGSSVIPALALAQFHDFSQYSTILDVGGGYGRTCMSLVSQYPKLSAILFDLPQVCEKARENLASFWLSHRVSVHPGDFFADDFPHGADAILLMRITHDWALSEVRVLLRKAYEALPSGGRLIIYETFKNDGNVAPGDPAIISLLLMLISPAGECRTFDEMRSILVEIGFGRIECIPTIFIYSMIIAVKP